MLGEVLGAAVYALVVGVAKFPNIESRCMQRRYEVVPDVTRLVQTMDQYHLQRIGIAGSPLVESVPAVVRGHQLREPVIELVVDQYPQATFFTRVLLRPPGPEGDNEKNRR